MSTLDSKRTLIPFADIATTDGPRTMRRAENNTITERYYFVEDAVIKRAS